MSQDHEISAIVHALRELVELKKTEFEWIRSHHGLVNKQDLEHAKNQIMSAITDWAATEQADLAGIKASLDAITAGIAALDALITGFQNSPGTLSAADQAALDAVQAASKSLVAQAGAISTTAPTPPAPAA